MTGGPAPLAMLALVCGVMIAPAARGQISLNGSATSYTQDFDTLPASGSATWTNHSTITGWYHARTGTGTTIVANNGSSNAGNLYSYGTGTATDRALGTIGTGNAAVGNLFYGVRFQNTSGQTITLGTLSYTGEQWRTSAAAAQTVSFSYLKGSPTVSLSLADFQSAGVAVTALDFTSPITIGFAGALDGNLAVNRVARSANLSSVTLAPGEEIAFRWSDPDHTGADHGLAIDDFSLSYTVAGSVTAPTVTTASAASIAATSATLGGDVTADGGAAVTERGVVYSASNNTPTTGDTKVAIGSGTGAFSQSVTGLASGTTYYVRAFATNSVGTAYGSVQTFTPDATPPTIVSIVRLTPATQTITDGTTSFTFRVTYSEAMQGVTSGQFSVEAVNGSNVSGSIASVSGSGTTRDVTVSIVSGAGDFRLKPVN